MRSEQDPLSKLKRLQMGIFGFSQKETGAKNVGNDVVGIILFLLCCTFLVSSLKKTALIFLEIFLIKYVTV